MIFRRWNSPRRRGPGGDWTDIALGAGAGFITGAIAPLLPFTVPGLLGAGALGGTVNVGALLTENWIRGKPCTPNFDDLAWSFGTGAAGGMLTMGLGALPKGYKFDSNSMLSSTMREVAPQANAQMEMARALAGQSIGAGVLGAIVANQGAQ